MEALISRCRCAAGIGQFRRACCKKVASCLVLLHIDDYSRRRFRQRLHLTVGVLLIGFAGPRVTMTVQEKSWGRGVIPPRGAVHDRSRTPSCAAPATQVVGLHPIRALHD